MKRECLADSKSMYVTRAAAQNCGEECSRFMIESGFIKGESSLCVFWHAGREFRCVVHGGDLPSWEAQLDWFCKASQRGLIQALRKVRSEQE